MLCRYGGHCRKFYSVAEHSVYVSYCVSPASALWGLIHDAAEAFLVDVPRPVKKMLPLYREIEYRLLLCVAERFGLPAEMPDEVKRVDNGILHVEREQLLAPSLMEWGDPQAGPSTRLPLITVVGHTPQAARRLFLYRYTEITGEVEIF